MQLTVLQLTLATLLLLCQVIVAASSEQNDAINQARDNLRKNFRPSKGEVLQFHGTADAYTYERKLVNKDILSAGKDGVRNARADFRSHRADHQNKAAAKDAAHVITRPVKAALHYASSSIVDLSSRAKHSSLGMALTPKIKTYEALTKKKEALDAKQMGRMESRWKVMEELRHGKAKPVVTTKATPNAVEARSGASTSEDHKIAQQTQHEVPQVPLR